MDNLEIKAKELEEKYKQKLINSVIDDNKRIERLLLEGERTLGNNNYSDEEITHLVNEVTISSDAKQEIEEKYKIENMANHSTNTWFGFDIMSICENMKQLDYEESRYLIFDKNNQYMGCCSSADGTSIGVQGISMYDLNKRLIINFPEAKRVINVHNHPHEVAAIPSDGDYRTWWRMKIMLNEFGIQLADVCVISELDFYSQSTYEASVKDNRNKILAVYPLSEETMKMIAKENIYIAWNLDHRFNNKEFEKTIYYEQKKKQGN